MSGVAIARDHYDRQTTSTAADTAASRLHPVNGHPNGVGQ